MNFETRTVFAMRGDGMIEDGVKIGRECVWQMGAQCVVRARWVPTVISNSRGGDRADWWCVRGRQQGGDRAGVW